jgi:predicted DNA binding CopG/RHH family protein
VKYSDLVESGATQAQRMDYLSEGEPTPITLRVPRNLKEAATETARLHGVSFSAFVRSCIINELSEGE